MDRNKKIHSIHALRGIAAVLVVVHHACQYLSLRGRGTGGLGEFYSGAFGVDIFFVISGFVIIASTPSNRGLSAIGGYLRRRAERVIPMYWIATAALGLSYLIFPSAFTTFQVSFVDFVKSILFIPFQNESGQLRPVLTQGWTLYYECFFYIAFAIALFAEETKRFAILTYLIFFAYALGSIFIDPKVEWVINSPLILEFLSGALLATWLRKDLEINVPSGLILSGILFSFVWAFSVDTHNEVGWGRVITWGLPAFSIVVCTYKLETTCRFFSRPEWGFIGDASYSIYLFHGFGITLAGKLLPNFLAMHPYSNITYLCFSGVLVGVVAHVVIENRINDQLRILRMRRET